MSKEKTILVRKPMELLPFLLSLPGGMSRKDAKNLLRFKTVAVPGVPLPRHDTLLKAGTEIRIAQGKHTPAGTVLPSGVEIVFEDEALIVINKPAGLLTIATESEKNRTAYAQITSYVHDRTPKGDARIFIVHRLDRETSGLLIFARTEEIKYAVQRAWKSVTKKYHAVVQGTLDPPKGTLRSTLVESDSLRVHSTRADNEDAKPAVTHYKTIRSGSEASLVELMLDTGRKNQIRVQLAEAGHPILGDEKYGATSDPARRLALHAVELHLRHPLTGEQLHFTSPLPEKLRGLLGKREPGSRGEVKPASGVQREADAPVEREPAPRERREPAARDRRESVPHDWRGPAPRDRREPSPGDRRGPVSRDRREPSPRDQRDSAPRDWRGPAPRDRREPAPRDRREPSPSDRRGPAPQDRRESAPRDWRGPAPRDSREPAPRDRRDPAPRDRREPAPRDRREPAPRDRRESAPRDWRGPAPRGRSESAPRDRREPAPRDRREPAARDRREPASREQNSEGRPWRSKPGMSPGQGSPTPRRKFGNEGRR